MPSVPVWPSTTPYPGDKPTTFTGRCNCGNVSVTIREPAADLSDVGIILRSILPIRNHEGEWQIILGRCGCHSCTRTSGALLASVIFVPLGTAQWDDPHQQIVTYQSSSEATRKHCGKCGCTLSYKGPQVEKENIPLGIFMRDDDGGKTNAALASRLAAIPTAYTECQAGLFLGTKDAGLAGQLQDGIPHSDFSDGLLSPKEYHFSQVEPLSTPPERLTYSCHCKSVRASTPFRDPLKGAQCCCLSCVRVCGGLIATSVAYEPDEVQWESREHYTVWGSRGFCKKCGSYFSWRGKDDPMMWLMVALLDQPHQFRTRSGKKGLLPYIHMEDQRGLRLPNGSHLEARDFGLAAWTTDEHPKLQGEFKGWLDDVPLPA